MKKTILLNLVVLLVVSGLAPAATRLVPDEYATIQDAIDAAVDGDVVIVATATYTGDGNRDIDFYGKAITVRSTDPNDPNIVAATVIDCQATETNRHRGFFFHSGEDAKSVLSGLTITNAYAHHGGGIYCGNSSPTINNCIFRNNMAQYYGYAGPLPLLENSSQTISNYTESGIMCVPPPPPPPPSCPPPPPPPQRRGNGGGIYCVDSNALLTNCKFSGNSAYENGGGMYNYRSSPTLINCTFSSNSSDSGGGMSNWQGGNPTLTNCTFTENSAEYGGGGMRNSDNSNPTLTNCMFSSNSAGWSGGLGNYFSSPILTNCNFTANSADGDGGAMNNYESNPVLTNCIFSGNSASRGGGAFNERNSRSTLTNCTFSENSAIISGGGIYLENPPYPPPPLPPPRPDPFTNEDSDIYYDGVGENMIITNCILWGNEAPDGPEIYLEGSSNVRVNYSDVQGDWGGEGNIDADPLFIDPGYWDANGVWVDGDYHLLAGSPCINAGDPNYTAEPNETDLDGKPRVIGGRIDMGAYEFNHIPISDAGPDQTVHAWIDGIAEVTLDGTNSYDEDGQPLTYYWNWTVDGNSYDANGVSPTIELPVGQHIVELIANDGIEDSEPDHVVITVIGPMESRLCIFPRVVNRSSRQPKILALLRLPKGVTKEQIDADEPLRLYPGEIEPIRQRIRQSEISGAQQTSILAFFDKAELMEALPDNGRVELQVVSQLKTGQYFYGTDTVRIISGRNGRRNHIH